MCAATKEVLKCPIKPSQHILEHMGGNILVLFSDLCFDLRQGILLLNVPNGQFFGEVLARRFVIIIGMLLDVEIIGVPPFSQRRIMQGPPMKKRFRRLLKPKQPNGPPTAIVVSLTNDGGKDGHSTINA